MSSLRYKLCLKNNDGSIKEIRRFNTPFHARTTFEDIYDMAVHLFPELYNKLIVFSWIDEDNDEITMTNDNDLKIALSDMKNNIKLYIKLCSLNKQIQEKQAPNKQLIHPRVQCDYCLKFIGGLRYKCIQCQDYDLCSQCDALGIHQDHFMIRMPQPLPWTSHSGICLLHHLKEFLKSNYINVTQEDKCYDSCNLTNTLHLLDEFGPILDIVRKRKIKASSNGAGSCKGTLKPEHLKKLERFFDIKELSNEDVIVQLLCLLQSEQGSTSDTCESDKIEKEERYKENVATNESDTQKLPKTDGKSNIDSDDKTVTFDVASVLNADTTINKTEERSEGWTIVDEEDASLDSSASAIFSLLSKIAPNKQVPRSISPRPSMPIDEEQSEVKEAEEKTGEEEEKEKPYHRDPKIAEAISLMLEMGFSNKNGSLTRILETENGDISKALDFLQLYSQ